MIILIYIALMGHLTKMQFFVALSGTFLIHIGFSLAVEKIESVKELGSVSYFRYDTMVDSYVTKYKAFGIERCFFMDTDIEADCE